MAATVLDEIVSGMGEFTIPDSQITFMMVRVLETGNEVHRLTPAADLDRYARLGFVSFGEYWNPNDDGARVFWRAPIWIEFLDFEWAPTPAYFGGDLTIWAQRVRYSMAPGAEAHIWVYGF